QPISGRTRRRTTSRSVRIAERVARLLITLGGIGTIVAVTTIFVFLVSVVVPLFGGADVSPLSAASVDALSGPGRVLRLEADESGSVAWALRDDGTVAAFAVDGGALLEVRPLLADRRPSAVHADGSHLALGFEDGSVQLGRIGIDSELVEAAEARAALGGLDPRGPVVAGQACFEPVADGRWRRSELAIELDEPVEAGQAPVLRLCHSSNESVTLVTVLRADGSLRRTELRRQTNLLTDEVRTTVAVSQLPLEPRPGHGPPSQLLQSDRADRIYALWDDGQAVCFDVRDTDAPRVSETLDLTPEPGVSITAVRQMIGATTLVVGDSSGRVRGWFPTRPDSASGATRLTAATELPPRESPVTALATSARNRILTAGYADGAVVVGHMTSGKILAEVSAGPAAVDAVAFAPRNDALLALAAGRACRWALEIPHPETTPGSLFTPVWYEGASGPTHTWQSSSGSDDFEPKLGLWPLVFGTLKASLYSLLFSVPIALLAAVYTSEFLSRQVRARIKPLIEMMASLPSVVLGFLAAIVIAPVIERVVPATLAAFVTVPFCFVAGARLWQLLPQRIALRLGGTPRLLALLLAVLAGLQLAALAGPNVERGLFSGDFRAWLDGQVGGPMGGWLVLTLPLAALLVTMARVRWVTADVQRLTRGWSRGRSAGFDLLLFAVTALVVLVVARGFAEGLSSAGLDARGIFLGTYVQRNALIVGFLTGFAVIPIMYTLAEDALSAVPDHLRAASLAAGATPWQTALRVVVPTAMSGLFSAVMIGIGRVVGETMIVLMAAGNTPLLDLNIFNGFRTLSATIAVELKEAVQDGTLYRVLFLAALALFAMTFVLNTIAEVVRQRFRKRAYEL
ncbi:MAG TPA: ABC transporter permease subunit, partial [Planctomycetota bacterium]|nr:ABC transporter permease subunit [Planctomycetota bacterium]